MEKLVEGLERSDEVGHLAMRWLMRSLRRSV